MNRRRERPFSISTDNCFADFLAVIIEIDCRSCFCALTCKFRCGIIGPATGCQGNRITLFFFIVKNGFNRRYRRCNCIDGEDEFRARRTLVLRFIRCRKGDLMLTFSQGSCRAERPVTLRIRNGCTKNCCAITNRNRGAWFSLTAQCRTCIISHTLFRDFTGDRTFIIRIGQSIRCSRSYLVNIFNDFRRAAFTIRIRHHRGNITCFLRLERRHREFAVSTGNNNTAAAIREGNSNAGTGRRKTGCCDCTISIGFGCQFRRFRSRFFRCASTAAATAATPAGCNPDCSSTQRRQSQQVIVTAARILCNT